MTEQEFIEIFKASFDELTSEILPSTRYKELAEWTSMQALFFIAHLDDVTSVVLSAEDIINTQSIRELFELVLERI